MNIFEISKSIFCKIINDGYPFATALKSVFSKNNVDGSLKGNVTALVGCALRHHLIFDNLISRYFENVDFEKTVYLRFYLANQLFLKRFLNKEILDLVNKDLDKKVVGELIDFVSTTKEIISENIDKSSPEFLSYRFNTPAWIIKMWQKQYGRGLVFKILKSNYQQSIPTLRVDTNKISVQELIKKHPELEECPINDLVACKGRCNPKPFEEFKTNKIFFMKMATKYVLDKLPIEPLKKMVVYSDVPNNIYLDLNARLSQGLNLDLIINHTQSYFETKKCIEKYHIQGIDLYNTSANTLITCVSSPVDLVICLPNSSSLDLLRSTPDYFLRIKQDKLDSFIEDEKTALLEASKIVNSNGSLVYMVPTLNKKESVNIIGDFLANNPDFSLEEEKQFFPFENYDSCLYFAILKKQGEAND